MANRLMGIIKLLAYEYLGSQSLQRRPEPTAEMDDVDNVKGFHDAGDEMLIPVYHFNALAISKLLPEEVLFGFGRGQAAFWLPRVKEDRMQKLLVLIWPIL